MMVILLAAASMLVLALVMAWILGWANKTFHVEVDPRVDAINVALPGANCGGCGYVGCNDYAEAVVHKGADCSLCPVGGASVAEALAGIMGVELKESWPYRPVVHCGASSEQRLMRADYQGEARCVAANLVAGVQGCVYGCLGIGDCVTACDYDAIHVVNGLSVVDYDKCVGCGACARVCPRNIISMTPFKRDAMLAIACSNKDPGKEVRSVCEVGCIGCGGCARRCDMFVVQDHLAHINYDKYDPNRMEEAVLALDKCPMKRIVKMGNPSRDILEKIADEEAPALVEADFKTTVDDTEWRG